MIYPRQCNAHQMERSDAICMYSAVHKSRIFFIFWLRIWDCDYEVNVRTVSQKSADYQLDCHQIPKLKVCTAILGEQHRNYGHFNPLKTQPIFAFSLIFFFFFTVNWAFFFLLEELYFLIVPFTIYIFE